MARHRARLPRRVRWRPPRVGGSLRKPLQDKGDMCVVREERRERCWHDTVRARSKRAHMCEKCKTLGKMWLGGSDRGPEPTFFFIISLSLIYNGHTVYNTLYIATTALSAIRGINNRGPHILPLYAPQTSAREGAIAASVPHAQPLPNTTRRHERERSDLAEGSLGPHTRRLGERAKRHRCASCNGTDAPRAERRRACDGV